MVGTKPTDLPSSKALCRHRLYDGTDVKRGMGDGGREEVDIDIDRWRKIYALVTARHIYIWKLCIKAGNPDDAV